MLARCNLAFSIVIGFLLGGALAAQVTGNQDLELKNWPAPLYWQPSHVESEAVATTMRAELRNPSPEAAIPAGSLAFVAMTPCRVVDTRASQMFPAPFGAPALLPDRPGASPFNPALCAQFHLTRWRIRST